MQHISAVLDEFVNDDDEEKVDVIVDEILDVENPRTYGLFD
jgi:hypothetical protein